MEEKIHRLCRLCFANRPGLVSIFGDGSPDSSYTAQILEMFQIKLADTPNYPRTCCPDCVRLLEEIRTFKDRIIESQFSFQSLVEKNGTNHTKNPLEDCLTPNDVPDGDLFETVIVMEATKDEQETVSTRQPGHAKRRRKVRMTDEEIAQRWQKIPELDETLREMDSDSGLGSVQTPGSTTKKKPCNKDRLRIIQAAGELRDWRQLAKDLGVPRSTATRWVSRIGQLENLPRGGNKRMKINESHIEFMLQMLRENRFITMQDLALRIRRKFGTALTPCAISNRLLGKAFISDRPRGDPEEVNAAEVRNSRRSYVRGMLQFTAVEKHIIYIGDMNVHMFSKRSYGQVGDDLARNVRPDSRWPNIRMVTALSTRGIEKRTPRRGLFNVEAANDWLRTLITEQLLQIPAKNIAIVCDTSPYYNQFPEICKGFEVELLNLPPHSFQLNPIEYLWPRLALAVNSARLLCDSLEEKLDALEEIMVDTIQAIRPIDCIEAVVLSSKYFRRAENMEDMPREMTDGGLAKDYVGQDA